MVMLVYMCMYDVKQPYKWCFPLATAFAPGIYTIGTCASIQFSYIEDQTSHLIIATLTTLKSEMLTNAKVLCLTATLITLLLNGEY